MCGQRLVSVKYDGKADVLYIVFGEPAFSFAEEVGPGVYLRKNPDNDVLNGITVLDYRRQGRERLRNLPVRLDFSAIDSIVHA